MSIVFCRLRHMLLFLSILLIWTDLRLTWDPANYSQIDNIFVNAGEVWLPQNTLADSFTVTDVLQDYKRTVQIFANGTILYVSKVYVETICNLNLGHFPFDAQDCPIRFMVNSYPVNLVSSTGVYASFDVENRTSNSEWHATSIRMTPFLDTQASTPFESVIFYIHLKRVPQFYIYVIILPCSTLSVLSIIGMFWNENRVEQQLEKLSIGLTSLMSMTVLLDIVATSVPKTKVFPLLGIFVLICVFIIGVGCVVLVVAPVNEKNSTKRKNLTWKQKILAEISKRNFILHWFFQGANLINFVVTISFWR
ncbi:unnamed protein product, partial [Mesorhabditis belari]|uniref:Neurotransmitter-gated ion-channel ligand-binding domain-containing protein n=1 Tax=Mesorhabditis belari TaxID=2138241 RepID=A0AAF3EKC0_9BILA